jgi:hypothetical protein
LTPAHAGRAPYPGLRSFYREETDLFFGRDDCVYDMVDRLAETRFLAVLGSSGTGKSSIVKTGLLDALERGLMGKAGASWRIAGFTPGGSPLRNLAEKLLSAEAPGIEPSSMDIIRLRDKLRRGPRSIIEWCHDGNLPAGSNLLLLVDQFEELFRYKDYAGKEESEAFVSLLLESAHSPEFPIYVTLTMRSQFLGDCALIEGLAETISRGMFLTPRMTSSQCRAAIEGPAKVCGVRIEEPLVNRLLNDLATFALEEGSGSADQLDRLVRRADQLPLLQYALNRLWLDARNRGGGEAIRLRLSDYEAIGGLGGALDSHGNQLLEELGKEGLKGTVEKVFRALISGATIAEAVRRPTKFGHLVKLCGGGDKAVEDVVYAFCAPGCNFLAPQLDDPGRENRTPLDPGRWIDISHESVIRQWKIVADWLAKEAVAAQNWRRLTERLKYGDLLQGRELANLSAWWDEMKPDKEWAELHGGAHEEVDDFLKKSDQAQRWKKQRSVFLVAFSLSILSLSTAIATYYYFVETNTVKDRDDTVKTLNDAVKDRDDTVKRLNDAVANLKEANEKRVAAEERTKQLELAAQNPTPKSLGDKPTKDDYAGEQANYSPGDPPANLQNEAGLNSPTPAKIPGGQVLTTKQVYDAVASGGLGKDNLPFVLIDTERSGHAETLPGAKPLPDAGRGGSFTDQYQRSLFDGLDKASKNWNDAIVFFGRDAQSWEPYNAALRVLQAGRPHVYWYRGGIASWKEARLKLEDIAPASKP